MLDAILIPLLASGTAAGVVAYLSRVLIVHWLSKDVETYKVRLAAEHAVGVERHKADLARVT